MKSIANLLFHLLLVLSLLITPSPAQPPPTAGTNQSFISLLISTKGLEFAKDILINEAVSSLLPLHIPQIENTRKIPVVGNVYFTLSNITIFQIGVSESYIKPGDSGMAILASGATANLSMNWHYSYYNAWIVPIEISDRGNASVQVNGMQVGLTLGLKNHGGTLNLSLIECGCFVEDINIKLDGGASWLYQGLVDAFEGKIESAVEKAITQKLEKGIVKLDSLLQTVPKEIPIDEVSSLNASFVTDPILSSTSIDFEINGLFTTRERKSVFDHYYKDFLAVACHGPSKMLGISVDEAVFNSASALYFNAGYLQWIVDKIPDQSLLNTAGWRFIIPQLYKNYPNHDMNLNISLVSPPTIKISQNSVDTTLYVDLIIDVLEAHEVIPVACILLEIQASGSVRIVGNNLAGNVKLDDFSMSLKWSRIGSLRLRLIQPVMWTLIQTAFLPYANARLGKGFPLPIIHGFTLRNAEISYGSTNIVVCSDFVYSKVFDFAQGSNLYYKRTHTAV